MADNLELELICPACGEKMKKVFMPDAGINIDICLDGCGGIFFDNRELNKFDEPHENADEILKMVEGREFKKVDETETRHCPICKIPMVKMGSGIGGVQIDVCNKCGAKFLDNGELFKIREGGKVDTSKADALVDTLYQENLESVLGDNAKKQITSSPRRQFFENLVNKFYSNSGDKGLANHYFINAMNRDSRKS